MKPSLAFLAALVFVAAPLGAAAQQPVARPLDAPIVTPEAKAAAEALGKTVSAIYNEQPNYEDMVPDLRAAVKAQIADMTALVKDLGLLSFADYQGIGPGGAQLFKGKFAHGDADVLIAIDKAGMITTLEIAQTR
jgi:hypothetical protein